MKQTSLFVSILSLVLLLNTVHSAGVQEGFLRKQSLDHEEENYEFSVDDEKFTDAVEGYVDTLGEERRRQLRTYPPYENPKWWGRYKKLIGKPYLRQCKRWILDHDVPPRSASIVCPKRNGNYTCFFGEQLCAENGRRAQPHPNKRCTCVDRTWKCKDWECPKPFFYSCPSTYSKLEQSNGVCLGDMKCPYRDDGYVCECKDRKFECIDTVKSPRKGVDDTDTKKDDDLKQLWSIGQPKPPKPHGDNCRKEGHQVGVGEDCSCCGSCVPEWKCTCEGGKYSCKKSIPFGIACACAAPTPQLTVDSISDADTSTAGDKDD